MNCPSCWAVIVNCPSRFVFALLTSELSLRMAGGEYRNVVEIADAMFNIDPLNEVALHLSVRALLAMRRKEDALVRYSTFMAEYQKENGEPYPVPFEKI